jgi:hypothetical protein
MTITNGYATIEQLQAHIDASGDAVFTGADHLNMELAIEAASRWIDEYTGSRFYATSETRYYTADWYDLLYVDDLISITTLKTDDDWDGVYETTWATTDYILEPRNAALRSFPYRQIRINVNGNYSFPRNVSEGVQIVGSFGYSSAAAPAPIRQACLMLAHRLWRRKDAIFGVAGTPGLGVTTVQAQIRQDTDILTLLEAYERRVI